MYIPYEALMQGRNHQIKFPQLRQAIPRLFLCTLFSYIHFHGQTWQKIAKNTPPREMRCGQVDGAKGSDEGITGSHKDSTCVEQNLTKIRSKFMSLPKLLVHPHSPGNQINFFRCADELGVERIEGAAKDHIATPTSSGGKQLILSPGVLITK